MSNQMRGTLYIGVTNNLQRRVMEHQKANTQCFTAQYDLRRLVYFQAYGSIALAISREKQLKRWSRDWKIDLIEENNPAWDDLYEKIFKEMDPESSSG